MINIIIGFILGFFVATMGFTGVAQALDKGLDTIKNISVKVDTGK
jgi:capsular polysaccharide biosynthesis protein